MAMFTTYIAWSLINAGMPYWAAFFLTVGFAFVLRRGDRAGRHPPGGERAGARRGRGVHRAAGDPQQRRRLDLHLHHQVVPEPVPASSRSFGSVHVAARARRDRRHAGGARAAVCVLPLHAARPRHARGGAEPGIEPPGRHPRRLDARARLGARRRDRRGRRHDGGADRLPRPEHDGRRAALCLRRRAAGRHRQSLGRGGRRLHRRRARERARRLRHRQRAQAVGGAGADHRRAAGAAVGLLRQGARDAAYEQECSDPRHALLLLARGVRAAVRASATTAPSSSRWCWCTRSRCSASTSSPATTARSRSATAPSTRSAPIAPRS